MFAKAVEGQGVVRKDGWERPNCERGRENVAGKNMVGKATVRKDMVKKNVFPERHYA